MTEEEFDLKERLREIDQLFDQLISTPAQFRKSRQIEKNIQNSIQDILEELEGKEVVISSGGEFDEEDIEIIQERADVSFEEAKKRLEEADGNLAEAIMGVEK